MKSDLKGYTPINVEYVIEEEAKEVFPLSLDFSSLEEEKLNGEKPITNKRDALKFIGKVFTATFPDNELVTRKLDDFEKQNIREEYCTLEENDVPKRKLELEIAIERAKKMKKDAEEAYASVLMEVAKYAAEVKLGTIDVRLKAKDTFCIALAGYYLVYSWDNTKECFVLAKAYEIPDRTELWANEEKNRKAMKELFGLDFAEMELISDTSQEENIDDTEDDDLPFGGIMYNLRYYQKEASDAAVKLFTGKTDKNGLIVIPTGGGKSLILADIASRLEGPLLVFQPSKEILQQNFAKLQGYGIVDCGCYSASVGCKDINRITFATIGSVMNHMRDFDCFRNIIIDEAHFVNSKAGQYKQFIEAKSRQVVGLTATPYRLDKCTGGSMLKFLTRTLPRIFSKVIYCCQIGELLSKGFLAALSYYDLTSIDLRRVRSNSTGADYEEKSLIAEYERSGFYDKLSDTVVKVMRPKSGIPRKGILVFTAFRKESDSLVRKLRTLGVDAAIVTCDTPKKEREDILSKFKRGDIKVVSNCGTLTTGFDYPELDTIILGRPTKSLALYYQMVGRAIRPSNGKEGWIIDLAGNYRRFGNVADLYIARPPGTTKWDVYSRGRQLTSTIL